MKKLIEGSVMKKKLLVLLIAAMPILMSTQVSAQLSTDCTGQRNGTPCGTNGVCMDGFCTAG
jgi:hypothetical protein